MNLHGIFIGLIAASSCGENVHAMAIDHALSASIFTSSRISGSAITILPFPIDEATEKDGYLVQREYGATTKSLGNLIGWKVGATNSAAQEALKFGPFYGPLFSSFSKISNDEVSMKSLGPSFKAAEAEMAFRMMKGLPKRADGTPHSIADVWRCVDGAACAIELAAARYTGPLTPAIVLSDFALNGCFALGELFPVTNIPIDNFAQLSASLQSNGVEIARESGSNVLGNPVNALTWLANKLNDDGLALEAGQVVITGAICASKLIESPGLLVAKFDFPLNDINKSSSITTDSSVKLNIVD